MSSDVLKKIETVSCKFDWKLNDLHEYRNFVENDDFFESEQFYNEQYPSAAWQLRVYLYSSNNYVSVIQVKQLLKVKYKIYALDVAGERVDIVFFSSPNVFQKLISNMFEQETLTDCVIKIDNQEINAHRCILAQNSEVFLRMFEQDGMIEAQNGEINIVDSSYECFRAMLKYFYSGEVEKTSLENFPEELFAIAEKYQVLTLKKICERFIASRINASNFTKRYFYAEIHELPMVKKACLDFLSANRKKFLASKEWEEFKADNKEKADQMLIALVYDGDSV